MKSTRETRDEALRQPTFRRLYLGALKIPNPRRRLIACYIILLAGRLGLRVSEIQHLRSAWIDWERGEICIPEHDPCGCRVCWRSAVRMAAHEDEDRPPSQILYEQRWEPKTMRGARKIPFGFSPRLAAVILTFQTRYSCLDITQEAMRNIVEEAGTYADGVDSSKLTVRGLRGTAGTFWATLLYRPKTLQDLMGWTRIETARKYLRRASGHLTYLVYQLFGAEELAPPIFPAEPEEDYPLVANPTPYHGEPFDPRYYGKEARYMRAQEVSDEPFSLIHPREPNPPSGYEYHPENHDIHGHIDVDSDLFETIDDVPHIRETTLYEFIEDHDFETGADGSSEELRREVTLEDFESEKPPTDQTTLTEADLGLETDDSSDTTSDDRITAVTSVPAAIGHAVVALGSVTFHRLKTEWVTVTNGGATWQAPRDLALSGLAAGTMLLGFSWTLFNSGIYIDLISGTISTPFAETLVLALGLAVGVGYTLISDTRHRTNTLYPAL